MKRELLYTNDCFLILRAYRASVRGIAAGSAFRLIFLIAALMLSFGAQAKPQNYTYTVAKDGSGDFRSVQSAIDASKSFPPERITIFIKEGIYNEKVKVHAWNSKVSLIGENKETTIISWDDYFSRIDRGRNSTFHTYTLLVEGNDFYAENLTIRNSAGEAGQAVALHVDADRAFFDNCIILGNQDTVYLAGEGNRNYFTNCYIEGTTDFIFGGAIALFEQCTIHSKKNSYITAASTPEDSEFGLVFKNCRLTGDEGVTKVYLGRPWRPHARTIFLFTIMGDHIAKSGWHDWDNPAARITAFYAEFENTGPGFTPDERADWSTQLTESEAATYTKDNIFGDWDPERPASINLNRKATH